RRRLSSWQSEMGSSGALVSREADTMSAGCRERPATEPAPGRSSLNVLGSRGAAALRDATRKGDHARSIGAPERRSGNAPKHAEGAERRSRRRLGEKGENADRADRRFESDRPG